MDLNNIIEQLGLTVPLAVFVTLGVVVRYIVDGVVSTFKIQDGVTKRLVMTFVVILVYVLWFFKDSTIVNTVIVPILVLFGISTGVNANASKKELPGVGE